MPSSLLIFRLNQIREDSLAKQDWIGLPSTADGWMVEEASNSATGMFDSYVSYLGCSCSSDLDHFDQVHLVKMRRWKALKDCKRG